jgi:uncharacterized protein (DUF2384 family)
LIKNLRGKKESLQLEKIHLQNIISSKPYQPRESIEEYNQFIYKFKRVAGWTVDNFKNGANSHTAVIRPSEMLHDARMAGLVKLRRGIEHIDQRRQR